MFYVSVPPIDHGLLQFPTNAYGGFAYRSNTLERPTTSGQQIPGDPTKRFITEHNLALFWRRPGLFPRALALPVPLLSTADAYAVGTLNRPPGMLRADCAPIRYHQRNLLAGELVQDENATIRIWTINDSSDHKQLLHYKLRIDDDNATNTRGGGGAVRTRTRQNLLFLDTEADQLEPIGRIGLSSEVLQLKAFIDHGQSAGDEHEQHGGGTGKVFMRTKNGLQLANTSKNTVSPIFHSQTHAFVQIPHMDGELAVVDARGMLFWGNIDRPSSFTRFKCPTIHKDICPTDCPRILVSIDEREVRLLDLRDAANCAAGAGQLLYTNAFGAAGDGGNANDGTIYGGGSAGGGGPFLDDFHAALVARDQLCHVHAVNIGGGGDGCGLETVLVTSSRRHTLVDPRMPGQHLLTMAHCDIDGADYSVVAPPFVDPETGGRVFSLYSLTHIKKPALSHWSLMYHPAECLWSSVGAKYELDTPWDAVKQFVHLHTDDDVATGGTTTTTIAPWRHQHRRRRIDTSLVPKYTRAIHYQQLDKNLPAAAGRALLFRQMEGGEIWYENVLFDPLPKLRQDDGPRRGGGGDDEDDYEGIFEMEPIDEAKMKGKCVDKIAAYQAQRKALDKPIGTHFFYGIQEELMEFRQAKQRQMIDLTALEIASEFAAEEQNGGGGVARNHLCSPAPSTSSSSCSATTMGCCYPFNTVHRISDKCAAAMGQQQHQFGTFDDQFEGHEHKLFSISVSKIWHKTLACWQEARDDRAKIEMGLLGNDEEEEEEMVEDDQHQENQKDDDEEEKEGNDGQEEEENEYDCITP